MKSKEEIEEGVLQCAERVRRLERDLNSGFYSWELKEHLIRELADLKGIIKGLEWVLEEDAK